MDIFILEQQFGEIDSLNLRAALSFNLQIFAKFVSSRHPEVFHFFTFSLRTFRFLISTFCQSWTSQPFLGVKVNLSGTTLKYLLFLLLYIL